MNFKIYVENGIKNRVESIDNYNHQEFTISNFPSLINMHLASKKSQSFLFILSIKTLEPIKEFMEKCSESHFQFIIIGSHFVPSLDIPMEKVLSIKRHGLEQHELEWYFSKYSNCITNSNQHHYFSDAETKDFLDDQHEIISIGQMLVEERDRDKLIRKILKASLKITGADAGSVFLIVDNDDGSKGLLFKYSYTFSRNIDFNEFIMPLNEKSIAGFCAVNDEVVNISDAYNLDKNAPFSFNKSIDETYDYLSRSMLVIPMKNHLGEILGVIQLINSKEHLNVKTDNFEMTESHKIYLETKEDFLTRIQPFAIRYEDLMLSVAGQASVALDNIKMIHQLEDQFEGMVRASVDAIDSKDPATSGHSFRVAQMGVKFLKCINSVNEGLFKNVYFKESEIKQMEYAALLHDYGKVYIDNDIFLKAKKLFPKDFSILMLRLDLIIQSFKLSPKDSLDYLKADKVSMVRELVSSLNEPRIFNDNPKKVIDDILLLKDEIIAYDGDNNLLPLLTENEIINLQIVRGTLNDAERKEIESHVTYTFDFLQSIPWPKELSRIPEIAGGHHEMLNGTGYPLGLKADQLSTESRVLAILDIFDALSASDRPYKDAVPFDKVQFILLDEAEKGRIDKDLLSLFFEYKIYDGVYSNGSDSINV